MKNLMLYLGMTTVFIFAACGDDDGVSPPAPENPVIKLVEKNEVNLTQTTVDHSSNQELGIYFKPKISGKITELAVFLPKDETYRVSIWDAQTKDPIYTKMLVGRANEVVRTTISPIALMNDKEYVLSVNTNDWFVYKSADPSEPIFPIEVQNINFLKSGSNQGIRQEFPDEYLYDDYYFGVVDITFLPDF